MRTENSLSQYSVDARSEIHLVEKLPEEDAFKRIERNFLAYENEVVRDEPVSVKYFYWFGPDDNLYLHPSLRPGDLAEKGFDRKEREGVYIEGFQQVTALLKDRPGDVVLWYSPPGKAAFVDGPDNQFSQMKFDYGQLYIQYSDREKVNAVAVKVNQEAALEVLAPSLYTISNNLSDEQKKTYFLLRHPLATGLSIDEFLDNEWQNVEVYKDKEGTVHRLEEVLRQIGLAFSDGRTPSIGASQAVDQLRTSGISEETLFRSYMSLINYEMEITGKSYIQLAGSCGGKTITRNSVLSLLGLDSPFQNLFSSSLRSLSGEDDSGHYPDYECPHCHKTLSGESKSDQNSWRKNCDHCGGALNC